MIYNNINFTIVPVVRLRSNVRSAGLPCRSVPIHR